MLTSYFQLALVLNILYRQPFNITAFADLNPFKLAALLGTSLDISDDVC